MDAAYKRIDKPLKLDGGANAAAARDFLKTRPKPIAPCSVLSQSEAEAIVGPLTAPPVEHKSPSNSDGWCEYHVPPKNGMPRTYDMKYTGRADTPTSAARYRLRGWAEWRWAEQ